MIFLSLCTCVLSLGLDVTNASDPTPISYAEWTTLLSLYGSISRSAGILLLSFWLLQNGILTFPWQWRWP